MKAQKPKDDSKSKSSPELDKSEPSEELICPFLSSIKGCNLLKRKIKSYKIFKQVKINIPVLDAIKQIPSYAKIFDKLSVQNNASMEE